MGFSVGPLSAQTASAFAASVENCRPVSYAATPLAGANPPEISGFDSKSDLFVNFKSIRSPL